MFEAQSQRLSDFYPWSEDASIDDEFIYCLDGGSMSSDFVFTSLLVKVLKTISIPTPTSSSSPSSSSSSSIIKKVHLVCTNRTRHHYEILMRKNGLDLNKLIDAGALHFVRLGEIQVQTQTQENPMPIFVPATKATPTAKAREGHSFSAVHLAVPPSWDGHGHGLGVDSVEHSRKQLRNTISTFDRFSAVFFDGLNSLELLLGSPSVSISIVSTLLSGKGQGQGNKPSCLVALAEAGGLGTDESTSHSGDHPDDVSAGENAASLAHYCKFMASTMVRVNPLTSGYSNDVHGLIKVSKNLSDFTLQFRALDSNIMCTHLG
jgi:hypothetical protein